jgi:hypothetical protein
MKKEKMNGPQKVVRCPKFMQGHLPKKVGPQDIHKIKLKRVNGTTYCRYSSIENKLAILYKNQEKILHAIKMLYEKTN